MKLSISGYCPNQFATWGNTDGLYLASLTKCAHQNHLGKIYPDEYAYHPHQTYGFRISKNGGQVPMFGR